MITLSNRYDYYQPISQMRKLRHENEGLYPGSPPPDCPTLYFIKSVLLKVYFISYTMYPFKMSIVVSFRVTITTIKI